MTLKKSLKNYATIFTVTHMVNPGLTCIIQQ